MSECPNILTCCPPKVFLPPPISAAAQLDGLLWAIPCDFLGHCVDPPPVVTTLKGTVNEYLTVTFRIRAIVEFKSYTGGSVIPGTSNHCILGGTPNATTFNIYSLTISNPAATYYINAGSEDFRHIIDYTFSADVIVGATVTMTALTVDNFEHADPFGLVITPGPGDPPINVVQPYQGQFAQMDVVSVS
jgi:hypothetical protein